jgi:hypothetical protein
MLLYRHRKKSWDTEEEVSYIQKIWDAGDAQRDAGYA